MLVIGLWLVGVLLPYYVQDIDDLPRKEVGGLDANGLWPATAGPLGRLVQTLGVLIALGLGPTVLVWSTCWAAWSLVGRWHLLGRTPRATYLAVIALSLLGTAGMMVTFRGNLEAWMLD